LIEPMSCNAGLRGACTASPNLPAEPRVVIDKRDAIAGLRRGDCGGDSCWAAADDHDLETQMHSVIHGP